MASTASLKPIMCRTSSPQSGLPWLLVKSKNGGFKAKASFDGFRRVPDHETHTLPVCQEINILIPTSAS